MASALAICAAVVCFWRGAPSSWTVSEAAPGATTVVESAADRLNETPGSRQLVTRPIRDIHPGMRVLADNPELSGEELRDAAIGPDTWRLVKLHLTKPDGSALDMELLRPRDWLALNALDALLTSDDPTVGLPRPLIVRVEDAGLADVLLGRTIDVDLPELGAQGPATVRAIEPCPPIESSNGSGRRVVTGTFRHTAGNVIDVSVEGLADPIGTTDNHPFWSADRQGFVPAGELRIGERLRRADGQLARVMSVAPRVGVQEVYNLEVDAEHVYCVSESGVLVHNSYSVPAFVGPNGPLGKGFSRNVDEAIAAFNAMRQTLKGSISPDSGAARSLAQEVAAKLGILDNLRGPEQHYGQLWHFHLNDFPDWHFWFNGDP